MKDGSPQVTPIWVDVEGNTIVVNTAEGRVKHKNVSRDPPSRDFSSGPCQPLRNGHS
jgi:hypothetical protein